MSLSEWRGDVAPIQTTTPWDLFPRLPREAGSRGNFGREKRLSDAVARAPPRLHQEHALAGGLGVEQAIGLFRLFELPVVGEEAVDIDLAFYAKARAVGLALPREGPRADD